MVNRKSKFLESTLCTPLTVPDALSDATDSATASEPAKDQASAKSGADQADTGARGTAGEGECPTGDAINSEGTVATNKRAVLLNVADAIQE